MRILYHYFLLTVFLLFNVPDVGASRQLFAIHPVIYPYPVEPMEYPEYSRRPYPALSWSDFDHRTQFVAGRNVPSNEAELADVPGLVYRPGASFLKNQEFTGKLQYIGKHGMYLHNIGGYGPGSPFYGSFGEYIVPEWQTEQIRKHLGHRFTGFDVGEQDGRFNFTYKQIMEPYIPDRRRQYLASQPYFDRVAADLGNWCSSLSVLWYWHYILKEGYTILAGAETQNKITNGQVQYMHLRGAGKQYGILWKLPIEGRINSEVYQVDMFKNGKLQYLFSTPSHLYLIDRNGNYLPRFPLAFKSPCKQGISVADYENNKNYRVFAPGVDHHVYLYELSGNFVKGWDVPKSDNDIVSKIYHFRVDGKDYLVYADQYRLYILDRKGKERVKVSTLLNLSGNTPLYLTRQNGQMKIAFSDVNGEIVLVDFRGRVERVKGEKMVGGGILNVEDINGDGQDEFVYSRKDMLCVYDVQGKLLLEKCWENAELSFPYVYRFSARDSRIGVMDGKGERLFLLDMKDVSKGFPIRGNSPFSITFGDKGNAGFYLFAGSDGTHLLKYRVLR